MKKKSRSRTKRTTTKSVLRLPDLEHAKAAVLNSLTSPDAQRGYRHAIDEFVDWYCSEPRLALNRMVVLRYRSHLDSRQLAPGTINLRLGAVRRLAYEAADSGLLSADLAAGIRRVKGVKKLGVRLGNWLTAERAQSLWQAPDCQRLKGKRDRALLALLLASGLRRHEAVVLTLDHLQQREEHWAIVDLVGKPGHVRTMPVPDWVKRELDEWLSAAAIDRGKLFRRVNKVGRTWGDGMTAKAVWHLVKEAAKTISVAKLSPHDPAGLALGCATLREVSWNRFNSCRGISRFRPLNAIWAASSGFEQRSMTVSASNRIPDAAMTAEGLPTTRTSEPRYRLFRVLRRGVCMKAIAIIIVLLAGVIAAAQSKPDEGIRKILDDEITTWNQGDTDGYSKHFAADGTFTNVMGMFFTGRQAFRDRHEIIFKGPFRGTMLQFQVVSSRLLTPDVAVCETLTWVSGFKSGAPPGLHLDTKGRLRTRLLQVMAKRNGEWQIVVYHNIDIKPDVEAPEPK